MAYTRGNGGNDLLGPRVIQGLVLWHSDEVYLNVLVVQLIVRMHQPEYSFATTM